MRRLCNSPLIAALFLVCSAPGAIAAAEGGGGDGKGNGGIDVIMADGTRIPIEDFFEDRKDSVKSPCDLANGEHFLMNGDQPSASDWQKDLNKVVKSLFKVLPGAGEMLYHSLTSMELYLLELKEGETLAYTDDDGKILGAVKENCAVQIPKSNDVYIIRSCWENYWEKRDGRQPYRRMLARLIHEALHPHYRGTNTYNLGKMVVEIMRLSEFYDPKKGHPMSRLLGASVHDAARILNKHDLFPTGVPNVTEDYTIDLDSDPPFTFMSWIGFNNPPSKSLNISHELFKYWQKRLPNPPDFCPVQ